MGAATLGDRACAGVVLATPEYPVSSTPVADLPRDFGLADDTRAFWGASSVQDDAIKSPGGRVLTVTALGSDVESARSKAYDAVSRVMERVGPGRLRYRRDIAVVHGKDL